VAEYQITSWRDLPSLVVARDGDMQAKVPLPPRFQEAIDEAAMRLGDTASDAYLAGWDRGPWTSGDGAPADVAAAVVEELEARWSESAVSDFLDSLAPPAT
jgi:Virulence factor